MENFIRCLTEYLVPEIGSERWQLMWNILNLLCGIASTAIMYSLFNHWNDKKRPFGPQPYQMGRKIGLSIASVLSLYIMGLASEFLQRPDLEFPLYDLLYPTTDFLDQFLNLRDLYMTPFERLPLANMGIRVVWVYVVFYAAKGIFGAAQGLATHFGSYLDEKFRSSKVEDFAKKVWDFLKKTGLLGAAGLGTAVVVTKEDYRDTVLETLNWLYTTLSQITLLSHLPENAASIPEMAEAFFVVILSILIVASYLLLIVAVSAVARILWDKRETILKYIIKWFKEVGYILLILALVLFVVLFSVLFATENASFQEAVALFIQNSPQTIFVMIQHTVMILAALGVVVLMCTALIAVVMFGINLVLAWRRDIKVNKEDPGSAKTFLKRFTALFLVGLLLLLFIFGYDPIRGWLIDRFANTDGYGPWWVVMQICSGVTAAITVFAMLALAFYVVLYIGSLLWRGFRSLRRSKTPTEVAPKQTIPLGQQIEEYLLSLGKNIFQIFKGYQTEDQKNAAIYVAACFASLASLVNTAVGLHDFNIGWILAIAMSFAVQLAMLIFGMKAGQGIAENIVSDVRQVGTSVGIAIARKGVACLCYLLAIWATKYGLTILFGSPALLGLSLGETPPPQYFLPVLLIRVATLVFFYGIAKQFLDVGSLFCRWWKGRKNRKSGTDLEDGLILGNPRRVPARYPLMAYLLFMLVSTTFAFTNLFGGYANQVQLHTRVYDQVYSETEKKLALQDTAVDVVDAFLDSKQCVLENLRTSYDVLVKKDEANKDLLERNKNAEFKASGTAGSAYGAHEHYINQMAGFSSFYESLVSFINREYDLLGEALTIDIHEYNHYQYGTFRYRTVAFDIMPSGSAEVLSIGNKQQNFDEDHKNVRTIEGANKYVLLNELFAVYENYAKAVMDCIVTPYGATELTGQDNSNDGTGGEETTEGATETTGQDNSIKTQLDAITDGLYTMERLDGVRRNIAELYFASDTDAAQCVSMIDLPRVMDLYLMQEKAVQPEPSVPAATIAPTETTIPTEPSAPTGTSAPTEPSASTETSVPTEPSASTETSVPTEPPSETEVPENPEKKYDKLDEYKNLRDYVDRAIQVYNILNVVEHTQSTAQNGGNGGATVLTQPSVPTDPAEDQKADAVYTVRTYRSYARGVASSNLQISFDALFKGEMGLNGTGTFMAEHDGEQHNINALYSAQMVAVFILIICALVDFMAFFSGLLLFQDIFLLDMKGKSKLSKLGYIAFDAILTKYLMPPERIGDHRKRKIALIYYLLYCEYPKHKNGEINKSYVDQVLLDRLDVDHEAFMVLLYRTLEYLESNSVSIDTPEFHGWLDSFVKKNGIEFDEVLL